MLSTKFAARVKGFDFDAVLSVARGEGLELKDGKDGGKVIAFRDGSTLGFKAQPALVETFTADGVLVRPRELYRDVDTGALVQIHPELEDPIVPFAPAGGGMLRRMKQAEFDARFKPAQPLKFMPIKVSGDWMEEGAAFPAYSNGLRWNGWVQPLFTLETAQSMIAHHSDLSYDAEKDRFVCTPANEEPYEFVAQDIEVEGQVLKVYGIGAGFWCWDEVGEVESLTPAEPQRP